MRVFSVKRPVPDLGTAEDCVERVRDVGMFSTSHGIPWSIHGRFSIFGPHDVWKGEISSTWTTNGKIPPSLCEAS